MRVQVLRLVLPALIIFLCFVPGAQAAPVESAVLTQQIIREGNINIEYPVVSGLDDAAAEKINALITDHVKRFHKEMAADSYVREAISRYAIHQNEGGLLSLTITQYHYSGGAHGMSYMTGYTFDLATGYLYRFTDLVPPWERDRINHTISQAITEQSIPLLQDFTELKAEPEFYLLPERKAVIFYQLYELAPYAWGFLRFPIDW